MSPSWSHARHTLDELYHLYLLSEVFEHSRLWHRIVLPTRSYSQLRLARLVFNSASSLSSSIMLWWLTWSLPPATGTYADLQRASWRWRRCGLAASDVHGAVHGGQSWVHYYSVLYQNSIFKVQYFSTCDISEFVFRYPRGCVPVTRGYIRSIVVDVLSPIVTLVRLGGMRLYRAIFVIYAYDRIQHDSCRTL